MKKAIFLFLGIVITYILIGNVLASNDIIPDDAIRIRVIANSNSKYDQKIKTKVKETLEYDMYNILNKVENNIDKTLQKENYKLPYSVHFGLNYFPEKKFKGITYDEGYYESVVVTLGEGLGDNWWCVLFPPLCMLEAEETSASDVEYTTMVKTIIDKYF